MSKTITHIAVIRLSAMGDVAMTVPVIRALALQHPSLKITVVSRPFFKPFFEGIPQVVFFAVDVKGRHKGFLGLLRLYKELKKLGVDAVADLHNVLRSQVVRTLFSLSGIPVAATDKGRAEKKALTRIASKTLEPLQPMTERHVATLKQLGFSVDLSQPVFPEAKPLTSEVVSLTGIKGTQRWIGIAPFAQYEGKVYPLDLMQKVIDTLAQQTTNTVFLFGGGSAEIAQLHTLAGTRSNCIVVAGKVSFSQELELISHLDVMLSMDSGNAHIAAMLGVHVVTLWGATHPYAGFVPFGQPMSSCLTSDREQYPFLPTSVYGNKKVAGYEQVMRTILPETVVATLQSILN